MKTLKLMGKFATEEFSKLKQLLYLEMRYCLSFYLPDTQFYCWLALRQFSAVELFFCSKEMLILWKWKKVDLLNSVNMFLVYIFSADNFKVEEPRYSRFVLITTKCQSTCLGNIISSAKAPRTFWMSHIFNLSIFSVISEIIFSIEQAYKNFAERVEKSLLPNLTNLKQSYLEFICNASGFLKYSKDSRLKKGKSKNASTITPQNRFRGSINPITSK